MAREGWRDRLRIRFRPAIVLYVALLLTPAVYYLAEWTERIEESKHPPPCYETFGQGCENFLFPAGPTTAVVYVLFLVASAIVIAFLHFGGPRLAILRSCLAIGAVAFLWGSIGILWLSAVLS